MTNCVCSCCCWLYYYYYYYYYCYYYFSPAASEREPAPPYATTYTSAQRRRIAPLRRRILRRRILSEPSTLGGAPSHPEPPQARPEEAPEEPWARGGAGGDTANGDERGGWGSKGWFEHDALPWRQCACGAHSKGGGGKGDTLTMLCSALAAVRRLQGR